MKIIKSLQTYLCTFKHHVQILSPLKPSVISIISLLMLIIIVLMPAGIAKSNPTTPTTRLIAFRRAKSLDNGISISWLDQTWNKDALTSGGPKATDFELLKKLGFKSIRLPVAFEYFEDQHITGEQLLPYIDNMIKQCRLYGFKLIIDYHYGSFSENNYLTETPRIINLWLKLAKRYQNVS